MNRGSARDVERPGSQYRTLESLAMALAGSVAADLRELAVKPLKGHSPSPFMSGLRGRSACLLRAPGECSEPFSEPSQELFSWSVQLELIGDKPGDEWLRLISSETMLASRLIL